MDGGPRRRARSHGRVTCTAAPSGPSPERPRSGYDTEIREQLPRSGLVQLGSSVPSTALASAYRRRRIKHLAPGGMAITLAFGTERMLPFRTMQVHDDRGKRLHLAADELHAQGMSVKRIARELGIAYDTAWNYVRSPGGGQG